MLLDQEMQLEIVCKEERIYTFFAEQLKAPIHQEWAKMSLAK